MNNEFVLQGLQIYTDQAILTNAHIKIDNGIIQELSDSKISKTTKVQEFPANWHLVPGFIDMHIHGCKGADIMDATPQALDTICHALLSEGVTAFLATTMTAPAPKIEQALTTVAEYIRKPKNSHGAEILGINLEGPFLSAEKKGAQDAACLRLPNVDLFTHWQQLAHGLIKIATIAPELSGSIELIRYLVEQQIIAACGHSNATYEQATAAMKAGCKHATHLFNAMRSIHQREPGLVTAALLNNSVTTELIADGFHLHPAILELVLRLKEVNNIILITDAMRAKQLADGNYDLGGQKVIVQAGQAKLADGTIAGSTLTMDTAIRNMLDFTGCSLMDGIKMAAVNPAKKLGIFQHKGSITIGKDADLVVLDENLQIRQVICKGKIA